MNCPLCHRELVIDPEQLTIDSMIEKDLICPITTDLSYETAAHLVKDHILKARRVYFNPFHYRKSAIRKRQIIFAGKYRVMEEANKTFDVCLWVNDPLPTDSGHWRHLYDVPIFEIKSEQHLLDKIKLLTTFS